MWNKTLVSTWRATHDPEGPRCSRGGGGCAEPCYQSGKEPLSPWREMDDPHNPPAHRGLTLACRLGALTWSNTDTTRPRGGKWVLAGHMISACMHICILKAHVTRRYWFWHTTSMNSITCTDTQAYISSWSALFLTCEQLWFLVGPTRSALHCFPKHFPHCRMLVFGPSPCVQRYTFPCGCEWNVHAGVGQYDKLNALFFHPS